MNNINQQKTYFSCCFTGTAQQIPTDHAKDKDIPRTARVVPKKKGR